MSSLEIPQGFGFVDFKEHESAMKAVQALNEHEIDSRRIFVARAQKRRERDLFLREAHQRTRMERALKFRGVCSFHFLAIHLQGNCMYYVLI